MYVGLYKFLVTRFPPVLQLAATMMNYLGHHRVVPWATRLGGQKSRKLGAVDKSAMDTLQMCGHCMSGGLSPLTIAEQ